jgi:hypothetical protein
MLAHLQVGCAQITNLAPCLCQPVQRILDRLHDGYRITHILHIGRNFAAVHQ